MNDQQRAAMQHYEAALKTAFPEGATGEVFNHWNEARKALRNDSERMAHPQGERVKRVVLRDGYEGSPFCGIGDYFALFWFALIVSGISWIIARFLK